MKLSLASLFCLLVSSNSFCQGLTRFPGYDLVDSVRLGKSEIVYVGFKGEGGDESVIVHVRNGRQASYEKVLTCYSCLGRGTSGTTYGGHTLSGKEIAFVQKTFNGVDSVFIDFSGQQPIFRRIIRHSYQKEKSRDPDYPGNYLFQAKGIVPITLFNLPLDKDDPKVKTVFTIKPLKWVKLWN